MRLTDLEAGLEDPVEVADMVAHMPRGGALGEWWGGHYALSPEVEALWENTHAVIQSVSEKKVPLRSFPESVRNADERERRMNDRKAKMRAFNARKRQGCGNE